MSTPQAPTVIELVRSSIQARVETIAYVIRDQDDLDVRTDELIIRNVEEYLLVKKFREMQLTKKKALAHSMFAEPTDPPTSTKNAK